MAFSKKGVCGIGVNDANYTITKSVTIKDILYNRCPYYDVWCSMIHRCYGDHKRKSMLRYKDCYVCDEWLYFSNFKSWMEKQDWEGKVLDKDLIILNNKIYSPESSVFVSRKINQFLVMSDKTRGNHPVGVSTSDKKDKLRAYINKGNKYIHLGYFVDVMDAHQAWQRAKILQCHELIYEEDNPIIIKGLKRVIDKISYDIENNLITTNI